ncbi:MAG: type IV pilin [Methanomicrobiales archaeon]|nr:type IV pilin [Methanomicrobiales archaeon]
MMRQSTQEAVSPVVGVMLMLVVTIIIAAVVSAFSGGLSQETTKAPQVTIQGKYSITEGFTIEHTGGDPIGTPTVKILVHPAESFGTSTHSVDVVNLTSVVDSTNTAWLKKNGGIGVKTFRAGDIARIDPPYHEGPWLQPSSAYTAWFNNSANVGKTFWVELVDPRGKMIAKSEITIVP